MSLATRLVSALALWSCTNLLILTNAQDNQNLVAIKDEEYCLTIHEDLMRRQRDEWASVDPFTIEFGTKHTPFIFFDSETRKATVIVGNGDDVGGVFHPMVASDNPTMVHFITHIYAVDQNGNLFAVETMDPNQPAPATVIFDVPEEVTEMTAYEFCNLHGLWVSEPFPTVSNSTTPETATSTSNGRVGEDDLASYLMMCDVESPVPVAYDSFAADFERRQSLPPFNSLEPYTEEDGAKHTPYIEFHTNNGTATVTVGIEGNYHVMQGAVRELDSNGVSQVTGDAYDASSLHWITDIYVVDQTGRIVTMKSLNPEGVDIAQINFEVPQNATTLTAYEWCNVHGLYRGPTYSVETGEIIVAEEGNTADVEGADEESSGSVAFSTKFVTMGVGMIMAVVATVAF